VGFVAEVVLDAYVPIYNFVGGSFKSFGESTGLVVFSDVGQGGINIGLLLINLAPQPLTVSA